MLLFEKNKCLHNRFLLNIGSLLFYFEMCGTLLCMEAFLFKSHSIPQHSIAYHVIKPFISISHSIAYKSHSIEYKSHSISLKSHTIAQHTIVKDMHGMTVKKKKKSFSYLHQRYYILYNTYRAYCSVKQNTLCAAFYLKRKSNTGCRHKIQIYIQFFKKAITCTSA